MGVAQCSVPRQNKKKKKKGNRKTRDKPNRELTEENICFIYYVLVSCGFFSDLKQLLKCKSELW